MVMIEVEKYIDGARAEHFRVPAGAVAILARFLPRSAMTNMSRAGLPLEDILKAVKSGEDYSREMDIEEAGILKKIRISVS